MKLVGDRAGEGKKKGEKNGMGGSCGCKRTIQYEPSFVSGENERFVRIANIK